MADILQFQCQKCSQKFILMNGDLMKDPKIDSSSRDKQIFMDFKNKLSDHGKICDGQVVYQNLEIQAD